MMKLLMPGLLALILIGCSSLLKLDRGEMPSDVPAAALDMQEGAVTDVPASTRESLKMPVKRAVVHPPHPADLEEEEIPNPCRNIYHPDLRQEIILKLTCMEENYK